MGRRRERRCVAGQATDGADKGSISVEGVEEGSIVKPVRPGRARVGLRKEQFPLSAMLLLEIISGMFFPRSFAVYSPTIARAI